KACVWSAACPSSFQAGTERTSDHQSICQQTANHAADPALQPMGIPFNTREEMSDLETPLYQDRFGAIFYDAAKQIQELRWFAETEVMTENDFRGWLERWANAANQQHAPFALIDTRVFKYHPTADFMPWRDEHIIPQYNRAGIKKFAFLLPEGS